MNRAKSLSLMLAIGFLSINAAQAAITLIPANAVRSKTSTGNRANLSTTFAANSYVLDLSAEASQFADGFVGINYPAEGQLKLNQADTASNSFVNKFSLFTCQVNTSGGTPSAAAFPFTTVIQDAQDGFYHACNGVLTGSSPSFTYTTDPLASWSPAFTDTANVKCRKVAFVFNGDFVTPVTIVRVPILVLPRPTITSSKAANTLPQSGVADFQYPTVGVNGGADNRFNFNTAGN